MARRNHDSTNQTTTQQLTTSTTDMDTSISTLIRNSQFSMRIIDKNELEYSCYQNIIGKGGFGTVYLGHYLHTEVAIKELRVPGNERNIIRELQALDRIRHPNIVIGIAAAVDISHCYIVMDYFKSYTLRNLISDEKQYLHLTDKTKDGILWQICIAISYLHDPKHLIVHGDLKPENILVNEKNNVKLCDLGSSLINCTTSDVAKSESYHRGTTLYAAPELILSHNTITTHSDIWALGCISLEIFTGRLVWSVDSFDELKNLYKNNKIPDILDNVIDLREPLQRCFNYVPMNRPSILFLLNICYQRQKMYEKYDESSSMSSDDTNSSAICCTEDSCIIID